MKWLSDHFLNGLLARLSRDRIFPVMVTALLFVSACAGDGRSTTSRVGDTYTGVEQAGDGRCPAGAMVLTGDKGPGAICSTHVDCRPVCCSCPSSPRTWLATACQKGTCASPATICTGSPSSPATDLEVAALVGGYCE